MEMRGARMIGMCGLVIVALGCGKVSKDNSKVLANVGGEKITENSFAEAVKILVGDDAKAKELLTNPAMRDQRNEFFAQFVDQKVMSQYGEKQGLAQDPKAKLLAEAAKANAYGQVLLERSVGKAEPTDAELKAFYDKVAGQAKASGQPGDFPAFDTVKAQVATAVKRQRMQEASMKLLADAKAQVPSTIDPAWKATAPAAAPMQ